jgi:hypothetical protein
VIDEQAYISVPRDVALPAKAEEATVTILGKAVLEDGTAGWVIERVYTDTSTSREVVAVLPPNAKEPTP